MYYGVCLSSTLSISLKRTEDYRIGIGSLPIQLDGIGSVSGLMNDADRRFMNAATNAIYCG